MNKHILHRILDVLNSADGGGSSSARQRLGLLVGLAALFGLLPMLVLAAPQPDRNAQDKIDPRLTDQVSISGQANFWIGMAEQADLSAAYDMDWHSRGWYVYRTLAEAAQRSQAGVVRYLESRGLEYESFWINNAIYVRGGDLTAIQGLAARPDVARLKADDVLHLPEPPAETAGAEGANDSWGLGWIHAPEVWALGDRGGGIVVANIDTGVQYDHPQLSETYRGTIDGSHARNWCDPSDICSGDVPCDNNLHGHGTHTMGTLSGENDDPATNPNLIGVAPDSTWIACKGCESNTCSDYALLECAQWIVAPTEVLSGDCGTSGTPNPDKRPHVVNNSWGDAASNAWYKSSVQAWRAAGIFPAFSAGNEDACGSVGSPGDYQESFASANIQSNGTINAGASSRGPSSFGWTPYCKPNVSAPGTSVKSSVPTNSYGAMTGTSMASPHTAGTVALLWSACPDLVGQIDATFQVLQNSARTPPADGCEGTTGCGDVGCNCTYGYGYLDALAAVQYCQGDLDLGSLQGHIYDLDSTAPISGAVVHVARSVQGSEAVEATSDPSGYYTLTLIPGSYSVTASKYGYLPETITGVVVLTDAVTTQDFHLKYIGEWTEMALPDPRPFDFFRFDGAFDPHDNLIYFPGGRTGSVSQDRSIWTYDPRRDVWADTGCDLKHNASNYTVAYIEDDGTGRGEALYVVGGFDVIVGANIDVVQRYYPSEPGCVVEDVTSDPFPGKVAGQIVGGGGVAVVDDLIYYFGGWQTAATPYFSGETWLFDPRAAAGARWTQIVSATLQPARSYINVAVQGGRIYALGGVATYVPSPLDLIATGVAEVFDPADPSAGWVALADLPLAHAEGRGFGFEADTLSVDQPVGELYIAGGGAWPDPGARVLEYDVTGDTWNPDFAPLRVARRDHAGSYVSVCTPDEGDGLPGMWVFGGRISNLNDEPPYGLPEYFDLPCAAPEAPQADFTAEPTLGCAPLGVQFTATSTGTVLERQWDFGDGTGADSGWRPVYVYGQGGVFTVTLTVSNTSGSDWLTGTIVVSATPQVSFTYSPTEVYSDTEVQFTNTTSGDVTNWLWRFSDGRESARLDPTMTFSQPGTVTVTLTVTGATGCVQTASEILTVQGYSSYWYLPIIFKGW